MDYFLQALRKYADFRGRARRKEYWMFVLFQILALIAAGIVDSVLGLGFAEGVGGGYLYLMVSLALMIPALAVAVRRLHDINKSGWFLLVAFIPLAGGIWLLVLMCTEGTAGENQYGPNPKGQLAF